MKRLSLFLALLLASVALGAPTDDWRLDAYDKAQAILDARTRKLYHLMIEAEPKLTDWRTRSLAMVAAKQKAERYGFVKMLRDSPREITFEKPEDWVRSFSFRSSRAEELARVDPVFAELARDFLAKSKDTRCWNPPEELMEPIRQSIQARVIEITQEYQKELDALKADVAKHKTTQPPEPMAPSGRGSP
jgi:hypothetical protein